MDRNESQRRKVYDRNLKILGCGYYSVCFGAGFECPCAPNALVSQGYSKDVWEALVIDRDRQIEVEYGQN